MSLQLHKMKIDIANDLGARIEDRMEGERRSAYELQGASAALKQAAQKVPRDLVALLDQSLNNGEIKDGMTALEVVDLVKKYLTRVGDYLGHLGDVEQQKAITQNGRAAGVEDAMKIVKELRDASTNQIRRLIELANQGDEEPVIERSTPQAEVRTAGDAAKRAHGTLEERRERARLEKKSIDDMTEEELEKYLQAQ